MRDLGDAVITWDTPVGRAECGRLFAAAAALDRAFAGRTEGARCPLGRRLSLFAPRTLRTVAPGEHPLIDAALAGWERFAEVVPQDVADAVSAVHDVIAPTRGKSREAVAIRSAPMRSAEPGRLICGTVKTART